MASEKKTQYDIKYRKEKIKRVPLDMQRDQYDAIKAAADALGIPVNRYIKEAVMQRVESGR